jgi:hypothetical protein
MVGRKSLPKLVGFVKPFLLDLPKNPFCSRIKSVPCAFCQLRTLHPIKMVSLFALAAWSWHCYE